MFFCFRLFVFLLPFVLTGCADTPSVERADPLPDKRNQKFEKLGKLFGEDTFVFGGDRPEVERTTGIGVNAFLWRASLDTISFISLSSADPFGGVILTEWYSSKEDPNERLKVNIFILGQVLRTDAIRAKIYKQVRAHEKAEWKDVVVDPETVLELENTILTRARYLRVAAEK